MADVEKIIGDPGKIAEQMEAYRESVTLLSSENPRMIEEYPDEWIGIHSGKVRAHGPTFESVPAGPGCRRVLPGASHHQVYRVRASHHDSLMVPIWRSPVGMETHRKPLCGKCYLDREPISQRTPKRYIISGRYRGFCHYDSSERWAQDRSRLWCAGESTRDHWNWRRGEGI